MLRKGKDTMSKINGEQDLDRCQVTHHHQLEYLKNRMPSQQEMEAAAELFKVFGDPTRLKLLAALLGQEMCVCDLSDLLGISQSAVSHQLRLLRTSRLVKTAGRASRCSTHWMTTTSPPSWRREWSTSAINKRSVKKDRGAPAEEQGAAAPFCAGMNGTFAALIY